jgi:hypothetical protein
MSQRLAALLRDKTDNGTRNAKKDIHLSRENLLQPFLERKYAERSKRRTASKERTFGDHCRKGAQVKFKALESFWSQTPEFR